MLKRREVTVENLGRRLVSTSWAYNPQHVAESYPWESFASGTIVDVGGSQGTNMVPIARKCPHLNFVIQDLPQTVAESVAPHDVADRIKFMGQ